MNKIYTKSTYIGCPVQSQYQLDHNNLKSIYKTLSFARDSIDRPFAIKIIIGLKDSETLDIKKFTRRIKTKFGDSGFAMAYSFEHAHTRKDHLEVMFVFNRNIYQPKSAYNLFFTCIHKLDGIRSTIKSNGTTTYSIQCFDTWDDKTGHNLKNPEQFKDAMTRYSYLSKQDDKQNVTRKRTFGTIVGKSNSC